MKPEEFTVTCNKCNSSDVGVWAGYDGEISIICNVCDNEENKSCDNLKEDKMMIKVIKTNLSINTNNNEVIDHQSYVQEEESWEQFIENVESGFLFSKNRSIIVENIKYDEFHLSCDVTHDGFLTKHLAYIEGRVIAE